MLRARPQVTHPLHTRLRKPQPQLLLTFEDPADRPDETLDERPRPPLIERDPVARRQVALEVLTEPAGQLRVAYRDVHLVIVLERPVVDVCRPDDGPAFVDDERLHVRHRGVVLVDPDPA